MKKVPVSVAIAFLLVATLSACSKKEPVAAAPVPAAVAPAPSVTPAVQSAAEPTEQERTRTVQQGKLDYTVMEDGYLNDVRGQWAQSATASSTYGTAPDKPFEYTLPAGVAGVPDGKSWENYNEDMGFDWVAATFAKPTVATAVRIVANNTAIKSLNKIELQDTAGNWSTVWSGLSDVEPDDRGPRSWFVKTFAKTPGEIKAVKVTFANAVERGQKAVDAIQLVGE